MKRFETFKSKEKFLKDDTIFYPGVRDQALKAFLTDKINSLADDFKRLAEDGSASDKDYQGIIKDGLNQFSAVYFQLDTEDRERVCSYIEELMDIVGLESSDGQLNIFVYGFNPGTK